jgi:hypothetical protein
MHSKEFESALSEYYKAKLAVDDGSPLGYIYKKDDAVAKAKRRIIAAVDKERKMDNEEPMPGKNNLILCQATMKKAIQFYLDNVLMKDSQTSVEEVSIEDSTKDSTRPTVFVVKLESTKRKSAEYAPEENISEYRRTTHIGYPARMEE